MYLMSIPRDMCTSAIAGVSSARTIQTMNWCVPDEVVRYLAAQRALYGLYPVSVLIEMSCVIMSITGLVRCSYTNVPREVHAGRFRFRVNGSERGRSTQLHIRLASPHGRPLLSRDRVHPQQKLLTVGP